MPQQTFFPTSVKASLGGFSTAELAKVVGNTADEAGIWAYMNTGPMGGRFVADFSSLPDNAAITRITANCIVRSTYAWSSVFFTSMSIGILNESAKFTATFAGIEQNIGDSLTLKSKVLASLPSVAQLKAAGVSMEAMMDNRQSDEITGFAWQKLYFTIDYESSPSNVLFFGKNF